MTEWHSECFRCVGISTAVIMYKNMENILQLEKKPIKEIYALIFVEQEELFEGAKKVLEGNWNDKFTTLYPHLWSWDSCFMATGNTIQF